MNSNIRPSIIIKKQLVDLQTIRESSGKYEITDFASRLTLSSLEGEEIELLKELQAAELIESEFEI